MKMTQQTLHMTSVTQLSIAFILHLFHEDPFLNGILKDVKTAFSCMSSISTSQRIICMSVSPSHSSLSALVLLFPSALV